MTFRVRTRDLTPTFGSPLGAQLVDVYVHDPAATATSTAASFPQRNYAIAAPGAWSRLIEVQGFGQRFVDAAGTTVGTVSIRANAITRYITFTVPKAALGGTPASGWAFTVVLAGQDGFSPDQARGFQPTPQGFQFGVCAAASADPHCTVDPGDGAEGDGRRHAGRDGADRRARLHRPPAGDDRAGGGAVGRGGQAARGPRGARSRRSRTTSGSMPSSESVRAAPPTSSRRSARSRCSTPM